MSGEISTTSVPKEIEVKIMAAIDLKKQLEKYEKEIKEELLQAMQDHNILSIKNDNYSITLASRSTYSPASSEIPTDFAKTVLDTSKVSTYEKLYGKTPNGVEKKTTNYITWRAK